MMQEFSRNVRLSSPYSLFVPVTHSVQERCISELEAKCSDLERENSELVSTLRQLEKRRESISSGDFPHSHHVRDPSVLSDSSFEHSTTKTTGSSSGVSSDLSEHSDSDNDTSDPRQVTNVQSL